MQENKQPESDICRKEPACRSRNAAATRDAILDAARQHFTRESYDQVGLRAIAGEAGVDAALICRYFGSKEQLFANVLDSCKKDPMAVLAVQREGFGERAARAVLFPDRDDPRQRDFIGLITHSVASAEASRLVHEHIARQFLLPFSAWLGGERASAAAWLVAAILIGVKIMKDIQEPPELVLTPLASLLQGVVDAT